MAVIKNITYLSGKTKMNAVRSNKILYIETVFYGYGYQKIRKSYAFNVFLSFKIIKNIF